MSALPATDFSAYAQSDREGRYRLQLAVGGMQCAGCAFKIEKALNAQPHVHARVNVTEKRLALNWEGLAADGNALAARVRALGFDLSPVTAAQREKPAELAALMRCMAVAGFASGNIMVFSLALWFTPSAGVGEATRQVFHWFSALLALSALVYSGRPFFASAWRAVRHGRSNMDVPISVALVLASALSLQQTAVQGGYVYFDSVSMLLFFLLVGRYLDARVRAQTRDAAADILALMQGEATVVVPGGVRRLPASAVTAGMRLVVARGEKILADGVLEAATLLDTCALTGESLPRTCATGDAVYAGMVNLGDAVHVSVSKAQADSLMSDIAALMDKARQGNARYVRMADRIAGWYTPVVHLLAGATFLYWWQGAGIDWQQALMYAATVLIITCPCALALAVPVSQVVAVSMMFRKGMLVKSEDAFERLSGIDTIIFDKTGTLTASTLALENDGGLPEGYKAGFAALAAHSRHPLSHAVFDAFSRQQAELPQVDGVCEHPGLGMEGSVNGVRLRLGSAAFTGAEDDQAMEDTQTHVFCRYGDEPACRLIFGDRFHDDAPETVAALKKRYRVVLLTGDRQAAAQAAARRLGIDSVHAAVDPVRKYAVIEAEKAQGYKVLMVGDGLNDAAALAAATASLSPGTAMGIAQNAADMVYQRSGVSSVVQALGISRRVQRVIRQNFYTALFYNVVAIPVAVAGLVTPLIAAVAMSSSSLLVTINALRLRKEGTWTF